MASADNEHEERSIRDALGEGPLTLAKRSLEVAHRVSTSSDDERLRMMAMGGLGPRIEAAMTQARTYALVSIAESLERIAGQLERES